VDQLLKDQATQAIVASNLPPKHQTQGKWRVERDGEKCNDIDNSHLLSEKEMASLILFEIKKEVLSKMNAAETLVQVVCCKTTLRMN
jgi:Zn-finger protein